MHFLLELSQALGKVDRKQLYSLLELQHQREEEAEEAILAFPLIMTWTGWGKGTTGLSPLDLFLRCVSRCIHCCTQQ